MEKSARFKYNLDLECVMQELFGRKHYNGVARLFRDSSFCRKCLLRTVSRIKNRLREIPMDERLIQVSGSILDKLEANAKEVSEEVNNDWQIITNLLDLIAHLLGYDWLDGKIHRHVIFCQDRTQEQEDWKIREGDRAYYDQYRLEEDRRCMLVNLLERNKVPKYEIANLLGISIGRVGKILLEIQRYQNETGKKIPQFE